MGGYPIRGISVGTQSELRKLTPDQEGWCAGSCSQEDRSVLWSGLSGT